MDYEEIPLQPDRVEGWAMQYIILGIVVAIFGSMFVVWLFLDLNLVGGGRTGVVVEQTIPPSTSFYTTTPLELERQMQAHQLDRWQWADRQQGRVRMPVDAAIDRYLGRLEGR